MFMPYARFIEFDIKNNNVATMFKREISVTELVLKILYLDVLSRL